MDTVLPLTWLSQVDIGRNMPEPEADNGRANNPVSAALVQGVIEIEHAVPEPEGRDVLRFVGSAVCHGLGRCHT